MLSSKSAFSRNSANALVAKGNWSDLPTEISDFILELLAHTTSAAPYAERYIHTLSEVTMFRLVCTGWKTDIDRFALRLKLSFELKSANSRSNEEFYGKISQCARDIRDRLSL